MRALDLMIAAWKNQLLQSLPTMTVIRKQAALRGKCFSTHSIDPILAIPELPEVRQGWRIR